MWWHPGWFSHQPLFLLQPWHPTPPLLLVLKKFFHVQQPIFWPVPVQNKLLTRRRWEPHGDNWCQQRCHVTPEQSERMCFLSWREAELFLRYTGWGFSDMTWMDGWPILVCPTSGYALPCNKILLDPFGISNRPKMSKHTWQRTPFMGHPTRTRPSLVLGKDRKSSCNCISLRRTPYLGLNHTWANTFQVYSSIAPALPRNPNSP